MQVNPGLSSLLNIPLEDLEQAFALDVVAPLKLLQSLSSRLHKTRILFIGSYSSQTPRSHWSVYSIGKEAQLIAARCLKKETENLKVGIFYPGAVQTDIFQSAVSKSIDEIPDQPDYQHFVDTNTVKTPIEAAKQICDFLVKSSDDEFVASCNVNCA